jgi:pyruvate dehydrogenase E1 component alpha subunit
VWRLPIVYVIVNNQLGMGTPVEAAAGEPELFRRGCSYRIPGQRVDGNDVTAVRDAAATALQRARVEHQPMLLETVCYRLRGHSVVDPARYRSDDDNARARAQDPVPMLRDRLFAAGRLDPPGAAQIEAEAEQVVAAAVDFADRAVAPTPDALFEHVYATPVANTHQARPGEPLFDAHSSTT